MSDTDIFENEQIRRLQIFLYLVPVFGCFPACWTLYRRQGNYQQRAVSRLVITLTLGWLLGYILLGTSSQTIIESNGSSSVLLLLINSLLTSSYFLVDLWLMVQLWRGRPVVLPGISRIARHLP